MAWSFLLSLKYFCMRTKPLYCTNRKTRLLTWLRTNHFVSHAHKVRVWMHVNIKHETKNSFARNDWNRNQNEEYEIVLWLDWLFTVFTGIFCNRNSGNKVIVIIGICLYTFTMRLQFSIKNFRCKNYEKYQHFFYRRIKSMRALLIFFEYRKKEKEMLHVRWTLQVS